MQANLRDSGSILGSGRSPAGGHGNPLQYSCLENPVNRGAWRATVHSVAKSRTLTEESMHAGGTYRQGTREVIALCEVWGWRGTFCECSLVHYKFSPQHWSPHEWEKFPRLCRETPQSRGLNRVAAVVKYWEMVEFWHNWRGETSLSILARKPNLPGKNHS